MLKNDIILILAAFVVVMVFAALLLLIGYSLRRERYVPTSYEVISERVRGMVSPKKITGFIPEKDIRITTNRGTIFWGWVISMETNSLVRTQWFRINGSLSEQKLDVIYDVRLLDTAPSEFETNTSRLAP